MLKTTGLRKVRNFVRTSDALLRNNPYRLLKHCASSFSFFPIVSNVWCFLQIFLFPQFTAPVWRSPTEEIVGAFFLCMGLISVFSVQQPKPSLYFVAPQVSVLRVIVPSPPTCRGGWG